MMIYGTDFILCILKMINLIWSILVLATFHILFITEESLKQGLVMKLMPGQLLISKHLALWTKFDFDEEQQL